MSSPVLSPLNWRPQYLPTPITDPATGKATPQFDRNLRDLQTIIGQLAGQNVLYYGARGDGRTDNTSAFQTAISTIAGQGGGILYVPAGTYRINSIFLPAGNTPISIVGQGSSTILMRLNNLAVGQGLIDVSGSFVTLSNLTIDGNVLVSAGLQYSADFSTVMGPNDPMAPVLTENTSVWLHGPAGHFNMDRVTVQHTGGYAVLVDCFTQSIFDVNITNCYFMNNRPHLFGTTPGLLIYGSWTGGIYVNGDGRTAGSAICKAIQVTTCHFHRNTGNCIWSHVWGLNQLHQAFQFQDNEFLDCGLDGIEPGGVTGVVVTGNLFRRIGYICTDDTSQGIPRWLAGAQATALDSSGLVINANYCDNNFLDINGGALDLDGHGQSAVVGNVVRVAAVGDPEYVEDQIAICGPTNTGAEGYGVNIGDTNNTSLGASNITIAGNTFINLSAGAIRMYGTRDSLVEGNNIISPTVPAVPPVSIGPIGTGPNQRATGNVVTKNRFTYAPGSAAPCVFEDPNLTAFLPTDINYVFGNLPIVGNGNAFEFQSDPSSGSGTTATAVAGAATINVTAGIITTEALTTAAAAVYTLTLSDQQIKAGSNLLVTVSNGTNTGGVAVLQGVTPSSGSAIITVINNGATAFNGTLLIQFSIQ